MQEKNRLTEGPLKSSLIKFTIPFLLSNLLQTLYGTVDTLVIGNFGSTAGVSAVATGAQALSLLTFFIFGIAGGSTVLLGRYIGAKDEKSASKVVGNTVIDFTVLSLAMTALMLVIYPGVLQLLNIPSEALTEAGHYMTICSLGIPLISGYNIVSALLQACGDSKSPLIFVGIACIVNILGDLLLTGYFSMGASGVAIATVVAQGVSFLFSLLFLMKKGLPFPFSRKDIAFSGETTASIARIGIPMGVQSILINMSFLFITAIINSKGLNASAAMGIGDKIISFAFMPQTAFSTSSAVMVSQNIGAGNRHRAWQAVKFSICVCLTVEAVFFLACQIWPGFFPGIFTKDKEVIVMAGQYMRAYSFDALITAIIFCLSGYLNGSGRTAFNMTQNLISTFLGRIPATWLLSLISGSNLLILGLASPAASMISLFMLIFYIRRMHKDTPPVELQN